MPLFFVPTLPCISRSNDRTNLTSNRSRSTSKVSTWQAFNKLEGDFRCGARGSSFLRGTPTLAKKRTSDRRFASVYNFSRVSVVALANGTNSGNFSLNDTLAFQTVPPAVLKETFGENAIPSSNLLRRKRNKSEAGDFDWLDCWYPVMFSVDVPKNQPVRFKLFNEKRVLWRGEDNKINCLEDICPHRGVPLSSGRIVDGQIECGYHGWTFSGCGQCTRIPQLPEGKPISKRACAKAFQVVERQGIVWLWPDGETRGEEADIPISPALDIPGEYPVTDYTRDMPYDYSIQVENLLDAAHVHFTHHGYQGRRHKAAHLEVPEFIKHFKGPNRMPYLKASFKHVGVRAPDIDMEFRGPTKVEVTIHLPFGIGKNIIYIVPTGDGECRILFRNARNFARPLMRIIPRWIQHFVVHSIADQDLLAIYEQDQVLKPSDSSWRKVFYMPTTSDRLVFEFRKWFEGAAKTMPQREELRLHSSEDQTRPLRGASQSLDRYSTHVAQCSSCSAAARGISVARRALLATAFSGVSFAAIVANLFVKDGTLSPTMAIYAPLIASMIAALVNYVLGGLENRFYTFPQGPNINKK